MAEKGFPKAVTGNEVGGWWEAGRRDTLGSVPSDTVEARDRSEGTSGALPNSGYMP